MKKFLVVLLVAALIISVLGILISILIPGGLIPDVDLPRFTYPTRVERNFDDLDIPVGEINKVIPLNLDAKYEGGRLYIKDIGLPDVEYLSSSEGWRTAVLKDGYWSVELSEEVYSVDKGHFAMVGYGGGTRISVNYGKDGSRGKLELSSHKRDIGYIVVINSADIYGEGSYDVSYTVKGDDDYRITNHYEGGVFDHQIIEYNDDDLSAYARYSDEFKLIVYGAEDRESNKGVVYYHVGKGWSSDMNSYLPAEAPEELRGFDEGRLLKFLPPHRIGEKYPIGVESELLDEIFD